MRRRTSAAAVVAGVVVAAGTSALAPGRAPHASRPARMAAAGHALPAPVRPAFVPGRPRGLGPRRFRAQWATVRRRVAGRAGPGPTAPRTATVPRRTPEGTANVVAVLGHRPGAAGRTWVRVRLPALPAGRTAWVPRSALGPYGTVPTRLDVDLRRLRATLYRSGRPVFAAPVGVGAPGWPTPRGSYYVRDRLTRYRSPAYGPVAFGTSARSPRATDWPAGGFVGIHGTDRPDLIPGRVSHGCIRLRNRDVRALARRMPIGTPVIVR